MTEPTPRSAAPSEVRRQELVAELVAGLDGVEELPLDELAQRLGEAQGVLAAVLNNDPSVTQLGLPGVAR
ncbi:MAG: hypothetical protein QM713_03135 [Arachnia sp.]